MSKKPPSEKESREVLIGHARKYGCETQLLKLFARYDDLLRGCKTQQEHNAIAVMALEEINQFFGATAGFTVYPITNMKYEDNLDNRKK